MVKISFDAGAVLGKWILDASDWVKGQKQVQKSNKSMMADLKKVGKAVAAVGVAFGAVAIAGIKVASDMEETQNKFSVVFRGVENDANAMRQNLVDNFGTSRLEASKMLSMMQDFLVPMGIARDSAAELSGKFAQLAVDIGSFNNQPTAQVMSDIQSGLAGQSEPLRKYGVDISETTLKSMALAQGIELVDGKLDRQARAMLIYQKITQDSADAVGDFARSQGSFANQSKIARARLEDLAASFGQKLLPSATKAMSGIVEIFEELSKNEELFEIIGETIESMTNVIMDLLPIVQQLTKAIAPIFTTIMKLVSAIIDALQPAFKQIARIIEIISPLLNKLLNAVMPLVDIIGDVLAVALELIAELLEALSPILGVIIDIIGTLFEVLKPVVHILGKVLKPILDILLLPIKLIGEAITALTSAVQDAFFHWQNLAKANQEVIDDLTKTREELEKMEEALKNGSMKQSELLKTQKELVDKYPELRGAIDLVNGSYENNINVINQAILKRKEEQIRLLEQAREEIKANKKRAKSWLWLNQINQIINPAQAAIFNQSLGLMEKKIISTGDEIQIAKKELIEFKKELSKKFKLDKPLDVDKDGIKKDLDEVKDDVKGTGDDVAKELKTMGEALNRFIGKDIAGGIKTALRSITTDATVRFEQMVEKFKSDFAEFSNDFTSITDSIGNIWSQSITNRETELDNAFEKDKARIEANVKDEEERTKALERLEEEYQAQKAALKKEAFIKEKIANVIMAVISTASAIAEALPNIPLAIAVGILGGIQVALIAAQPVPEFQKGGFHTGGLALVGEEGPELADFGSPAQIFNAEETRRMLNGTEINNNFYGDMNTDIDLNRLMQLSGAKYRSTQRFAS